MSRTVLPRSAARLLAALLAFVLTSGAARASRTLDPTSGDLDRALDDVLACERPDGGWTYGCEPGPDGAVTKIVVRAQQIAALLGLPLWDLLVVRSPGTPAGGLELLEGWRRTGNDRWLAGAARRLSKR